MSVLSTAPTDNAAQAELDTTLIHLPNQQHPFELQQHYCNNPDCHCNEALLTLTETVPQGQPLSFGLCLDLASWQEKRPPPRPGEVDQLVDAFLEALTPALKSEFQTHYRETKEIFKRLADYRLEPKAVRKGTLVSYQDVVSASGGVASGGRHYTFRLQQQDRDYLIEDLYCPNPACPCKEAHLLFMRYRIDDEHEPVNIKDTLLARVPLRGKATIEDVYDGTEQEAKALLVAWQQAYPQAQVLLKTRYEDIKAVGERSLNDAPERLIEPADRKAPKIGRNEPCPCGSGKKYKKCCG